MPARWPISCGASAAATPTGARFPDKVAIQLNDTHPSLAVPELMRILLDEAQLGWDQAWDLTHGPWPTRTTHCCRKRWRNGRSHWFELLLPRHLEIIYEINRRLLDDVRGRIPGDEGRVERMSLVEEGGERKIRMANLAIVGSHSTNGVAAIHSAVAAHDDRQGSGRDVSRAVQQQDQRRHAAALAAAGEPGAGRSHHRGHRRRLDHRSRSNWQAQAAGRRHGFRDAFRKAKREAKVRFAHWLKSTAGEIVDPDTIFDCQVKRIHEYKRQLLNALRIVVLYNRLRQNPGLEMPPRTFFFAGKAAPAYHLAKVIIKFINNLAGTIDGDPAVRGRLKVVFLPEYSVSLAERLIPASDVSNQISTAGYEASGTSNMKFMMNGALTIGTRDGATIEMAEEAGEENFFLFGLTAEQVAGSRGWYNPHWHYENEPETRAALDLIFSDHFSRDEPGVFDPLRETLLTHGDHYMHLADLASYLDADQTTARAIRRPRGLGAQGDPERGRLRAIFQRPHHCRIRLGNMGCKAVRGVLAGC